MACRNSDLARFSDTSVSTGKVACSHQVELYAHYSNSWKTPMCGQEFKLRQGSEVIAQGCLRSLADLGLSPDGVIHETDQRKLGTCHVKDLSPGAYTFELVQQGSEGKVQKLEKEIENLTKDIVKEYKTTYEPEWKTWKEESALGKSGLLIQSALGGFMEGLDKWLESEQGFWDSIGDFFSDLWESIKDVLGDIADALHPSRILQTAKDIWEGACSTAKAIGEYVSELPEKIADVYAGTLRIIENIGAIARFMKDFTTGNWEGIEAFIDKTLPNLCENEETAKKWAQTMRNNAEGWAMVLELVGGTRAPALLVGAITSISAAIPPQVWASVGIASVVIISIELIIAKILILFTTVVGAVSAGAGAVVGGVLLVGRAAKLAKIGGQTWKFVKGLMDKLQVIIDKMVELGEAAVKARRGNTVQGRQAPANTGDRTTQNRPEEEKGQKCDICGKELGKNGHPKTTPSFKGGRVEKGNNYRDPLIKHAKKDPTSICSISSLLDKAQAHHLVSEKGLDMTEKSEQYEKLGYNINNVENLSMIPSNAYLACHLKCQLHSGDHSWNQYDYHDKVNERLESVTNNLDSYCKTKEKDKIQSDVDIKSKRIANAISRFSEFKLTQDYRSFDPKSLQGCGNVKGRYINKDNCDQNRKHSEYSNIFLPIPYPIRPEA